MRGDVVEAPFHPPAAQAHRSGRRDHLKVEPITSDVVTIGLDPPKSVFQVRRVDVDGSVPVKCVPGVANS